ncbi:DUF493 domain-containing protein [Marinospirillum sp. MEB164]|uniref:UPF0250 protein V6U78_08565 n=1 Tax=Marinospirillum alkalitolerans TaxID=3123374 RepID=A0ABW8PXR8_9GAMM
MSNSNPSVEANAPKIDFPCDYPIKVMGEAAPDFKVSILDVLVGEATEYHQQSVTVVDSRNGRFQSVRVTVKAESPAHLDRLFQALKATGRVHMVL